MFFKVLAAIVTADALDRHMREQQHRAWIAGDAARRDACTVPGRRPSRASDVERWWEAEAPERP